jgi:hypothetical protein
VPRRAQAAVDFTKPPERIFFQFVRSSDNASIARKIASKPSEALATLH